MVALRVTAAGLAVAPGAVMAVAQVIDWESVAKAAAREAATGVGEREVGWVAQVAVLVT